MTYTAYEGTSGQALVNVQMFCRHLTRDGSFTSLTHPPLTQVEAWLTLSHHKVAGVLVRYGYSATQTDTEVVGILEQLNSLETAIAIELMHPVTGTGDPNNRMITFIQMRDELMALIMSTSLGALGGTALAADLLTKATGISQGERDTLQSDTDNIPHRFQRGQFVYPGVLAPVVAEERIP